MATTVDEAGRITIPAEIREQAHLKPGAELEVTVLQDGSIRLSPRGEGPELIRRNGRWVARPTAPTGLASLDFAKLVEEERDRWSW